MLVRHSQGKPRDTDRLTCRHRASPRPYRKTLAGSAAKIALDVGVNLWIAAEQKKVNNDMCDSYRILAAQKMRKVTCGADQMPEWFRAGVGGALFQMLRCE